MNKKRKFISLVLGILLLSSCSFAYQNKSIDEMSTRELESYSRDLENDNKEIQTSIDEIKAYTDDKSEEEMIEMINYINTEIVKSNVMITNQSKSLFHTTAISSGSGTIIKEDTSYYYVLTNNHVIYSLGSRSYYYIYDYLNNEYQATLLFHSPDYDLALLKFSKTRTLRVNELASENIEIGKGVIAIGQPLGQRNAITFGKALKYDTVDCSTCNPDESNIQYQCVFYTANTNNGNSGGMLIDYNYKLVGVVTYGLSDARGNYMYGAGSPVAKIREFLTSNSFEVGDTNA